MAPNPQGLIDHFRDLGYHPRSDKHSNALSDAIVRDLLDTCPAMAARAGRGDLVYDLNFTILSGTAEWNVDLVLGKPPPGTQLPSATERIIRSAPSMVEIAIEHKAVMTEHRKAIKNRKRDFEAHHDHVHRYRADATAAGVLIVNVAAQFQSALRPTVTAHRNPDALVAHCISEMRAVAVRAESRGVGLDAKAVLVVDFENIRPYGASYRTSPPAPQVGDPLHYDAFVQTVCNRWMQTTGQ